MSRSLEQLDNDLGVIEALLEDAPVQDMDEMSFPIAEKALNSLQWQAVSVATGSGIADRGGQPFWLRDLSNTTDSARLTVSTTTKTAEASIMGFFFQMKRDVTVPLPPVSSPTTYHVGLEFDPTRLKDATGPIRRVVHKNTIPYTGGKIYLPFWEVTRNPNQLLSDAKVVQKRPKVSPSITIDYWENRPDPRSQLWGTRMTLTHGEQRGETYIALGASEITGGPTNWTRAESEWVNTNYIPNYEYVGHGYRLARKKDGRTVRLRGRMSRTNGKDFTQSDAGYWAMQLPEGWRPAHEVRVPTVSRWGSPQFVNVVNISTGGEVRIFPGGTTGWVCLDGISFDVE